jgi:protein-tyrosine-phosphatase/DNA-binding transcriptional ArsR family regulator
MESNLSSRFEALSHPQRLAIFRLLMRRFPDALPAGEIARVLDFKPSTASVYLATLTRTGLIDHKRRGTSILYSVNMEASHDLVSDLFLDCCRGRSDVGPRPIDRASVASVGSKTQRYNVLFVCTGNSARSIFAEAVLKQEGGDRFTAYSAGADPRSQINPFALDLLRDRGIETNCLRPKPLWEFRAQDAPRMDFVFTVCDLAANEECAAWHGCPISSHWGLPDPAAATGSEAEKRHAFERCFGEITNMVRDFASLPFASLDPVALQKHLDDIGRKSEHA